MKGANTYLQRIADAIDGLSETIGRVVAWLTVFMVLITFAVVVLRYVFNLGWIAMQEAVVFLHAVVFLLAAGYTLKHEAHVRVDLVYRTLSERARAWVDLLGTLLLLAPVCVFVLWVSWDYVAISWSLREGSREAGGLPGVFLLKTAIPVAAALILLQGLSLALRSYLRLVNIVEGNSAGGESP